MDTQAQFKEILRDYTRKKDILRKLPDRQAKEWSVLVEQVQSDILAQRKIITPVMEKIVKDKRLQKEMSYLISYDQQLYLQSQNAGTLLSHIHTKHTFMCSAYTNLINSLDKEEKLLKDNSVQEQQTKKGPFSLFLNIFRRKNMLGVSLLASLLAYQMSTMNYTDAKTTKQLKNQHNTEETDTTSKDTGTVYVEDKQEQQRLHLKINPAFGRLIISDYGTRVHPVSKELKMHHGIDVHTETVFAAGEGIIEEAGFDAQEGNYIIILHKYKNNNKHVRTCYYHLNSINVKKGQEVDEHTVLGKQGQTGKVDGVHLHFAVMLGGKGAEYYVDPSDFIFLTDLNDNPYSPTEQFAKLEFPERNKKWGQVQAEQGHIVRLAMKGKSQV